jgi:hypothetical protein
MALAVVGMQGRTNFGGTDTPAGPRCSSLNGYIGHGIELVPDPSESLGAIGVSAGVKALHAHPTTHGQPQESRWAFLAAEDAHFHVKM